MNALPPPSATPPPSAPPPPPTPPPPWPDDPAAAQPWPWDAPETRIRISGSEELIAAVPVLIGFHPRDSLVLVGLAGPERRGRVGLTLRVDLPAPADVRRVCTDTVAALAGAAPARAVAVVVRAGRTGPAGPYPARRDVATGIRRELLRAGIEPLAVLWAAGTRHGDPWCCYDLPGQRCRCAGTVPDPSATPAAAAAVLRGRQVLPDRAALAAQLDGDERDLTRRDRLRAAAPERSPATHDGASGALLERCLHAAARGRLTVDDALALRFCAAFDEPTFRDEAVRRCLDAQAPHAEQLWAVLCRALPAPERADPAALLAVCALLRGDGALATLATERALDACPGHGLASLVDASVRGALDPGAGDSSYPGPEGLRTLLHAAYAGDPGEDPA